LRLHDCNDVADERLLTALQLRNAFWAWVLAPYGPTLVHMVAYRLSGLPSVFVEGPSASCRCWAAKKARANRERTSQARGKLQAYRRSSRVATDWLEEQPGQSPNERVQAVAMGWDWEWRVWNTMRALPQQHECHELKCSSIPLACTPVHSIHGFSTIVDAAGTLKLDAKGTSRGTCRRPSKRAKFKSTAEPDKDKSSSGIPIDVKVASPSLATVPY